MYLDAAEQEREKYVQEMAAYKQTEAYRLFNEHKLKKKMKTSTTTTTDDVSIWNFYLLFIVYWLINTFFRF